MKNHILIFFACILFSCLYASPSLNINQLDALSKGHDKIASDTSDRLLQYHLDSNEVFTEYWINDVLFVYEDLKFSELPDSVVFNLVNPEKDEKFKLTWYGALNSPYGPRWGRMHHGLDLHLRTGDPVYSAFDGIVRYAQFNSGGYGNCVIVRHFNGLETLYGHLSKIEVSANQMVKAGELIGLGGSTGRSQGPHLHFETRYRDFSFDSFRYIDKESKELISDTFVLYKKNLINHRYPSDAKNKVEVMEDDKGIKDPAKKYAAGNKSKYPSPPKKIIKTKAVYHTVKKGESIASIARKYKTTWVNLRKINGLKQNAILQPGQKLRVK
jgi:LysM repeat protein